MCTNCTGNARRQTLAVREGAKQKLKKGLGVAAVSVDEKSKGWKKRNPYRRHSLPGALASRRRSIKKRKTGSVETFEQSLRPKKKPRLKCMYRKPP